VSVTISYEDLIRAWQTSSTMAEVCKKLNGAEKKRVVYMASKIKKLGVQLKGLNRSHLPLPDVQKLKALARQYSGGVP
jgi:hypothetical protein